MSQVNTRPLAGGSEPDADPERVEGAGSPSGSEAAAAAESGQADSIGRYLARQRVLRGISVEELSALTRLPVRSIERLEAGSFDQDSDGFVRGFVRTVATALGLDPHDTLTRMMVEPKTTEPMVRPLGVGLARIGLLVIAIAVVAVSAGVIRQVGRPAPTVADPAGEVIYRRDPVRALANAQRRGAASGGSPLLLPQPRRGDIGATALDGLSRGDEIAADPSPGGWPEAAAPRRPASGEAGVRLGRAPDSAAAPDRARE